VLTIDKPSVVGLNEVIEKSKWQVHIKASKRTHLYLLQAADLEKCKIFAFAYLCRFQLCPDQEADDTQHREATFAEKSNIGSARQLASPQTQSKLR
jgi:hypothetical protein